MLSCTGIGLSRVFTLLSNMKAILELEKKLATGSTRHTSYDAYGVFRAFYEADNYTKLIDVMTGAHGHCVPVYVVVSSKFGAEQSGCIDFVTGYLDRATSFLSLKAMQYTSTGYSVKHFVRTDDKALIALGSGPFSGSMKTRVTEYAWRISKNMSDLSDAISLGAPRVFSVDSYAGVETIHWVCEAFLAMSPMHQSENYSLVGQCMIASTHPAIQYPHVKGFKLTLPMALEDLVAEQIDGTERLMNFLRRSESVDAGVISFI